MPTWWDRLTGGKRWASLGVLDEPTDGEANTGFNFLGQATPTAELHDALFQYKDDADIWLYNLIKAIADDASIPLSATQSNTLLNSLRKRFVQNGTGIGQLATNSVKLGWTAQSQLKASVDTSDLGKVWTDHLSTLSPGSNGYLKLPNGFIIQWLSVIVGSGNAQGATLPVAYPTAHLAAVCSYQASIPPTTGNIGVEPFGLTGVKFYNQSGSSNGVTAFSIGY